MGLPDRRKSCSYMLTMFSNPTPEPGDALIFKRKDITAVGGKVDYIVSL